MGKTGSSAQCTFRGWNTAVLFLWTPPPFFFPEFNTFPTSFSIFCLYTHLLPQCSLFAPLQNSTGAKMFSPFLFFLSSCLYKHNMYRNSTQTNMFLNYSFHIQIQFLWVLNSPHEPATYIHNEFFSFFSFCSLISQIISLRWRILAVSTHKAHTIWAGSFGACMHSSCARASPMPVCVPVGVMWHGCVFLINMLYEMCSQWHLHVAVQSDPRPSSGIYIGMKMVAVGCGRGG